MLKKFYKFPLLCLAVVMLLAFFGPLLSPYSAMDYSGGLFEPPSSEHWLGTNRLGQDIFSQLLYGTRTSVLIGLCIALCSTVLSVLLGLAAGYLPKFDKFINGLANILLVLPNLLLILLVVAFTGSGVIQLVIILSLLSWPGYMRIIRSSVLTLKEREFVKASALFGGSSFYVLKSHILPQLQPIIKTKFVMTFQSAVLTEAGLAFLGLGDPNVISWGSMLNMAFTQTSIFLTGQWTWIVLPPVIMLLITSVSLAFLLEDKQKKSSKTKKQKGTTPVTGKSRDLYCHLEQVTYDETTIVENIEFTIKRGEIVSLIGPSGSGKTTIARALYGLLPAENWVGDVTYDGESVREKSFREKHYWKTCSFIYQDARAAFNPVLKIKEQFLETGISLAEAEKSVEEVALNKNILDKYPHECSGGMLSRALIALSLVNKPAFVIADECTSALDPILKKEVVELLEEKVRSHGISLLFITHDLDVAYAISDRIFSLSDKQLMKEVQ
ncbi:ATP-binding cassette domain-containing protein [Bacillus sp. D386]|uniref:ATP-binding cassette domain-containing protein n=1 Tax=Bacillus sp. D386 TaxID=2587155 RepID=UPI00111EE4B8|nr:ATP-binding cassette domain-containing protein [Bacillus sp. D386]